MKITSEILIFIWILIISTEAREKEYSTHPEYCNWTKAWKTCEKSGRFLLPDLGVDGFWESGIFDDLEVEELVWLNAKDVEMISYKIPVHLKLAQLPEDSKFEGYLCHNEKAKTTKKFVMSSALTWTEAYSKCNSSAGFTLYDISTPEQVRGVASLLREDVPFWLAKTSMGRIPDMVSEKSNTDEKCLGIMKMADGSLAYRRANCSEKHRFFSVSSVDKYALAITKMTAPYPVLSDDMHPDNGYEAETIRNRTNDRGLQGDDPHDETSSVTGAILGALGGVVAIIFAGIGIYFLRRRWRSRRDYLRSLHRYTQRHASARELIHNTLTQSGSLSVSNIVSGPIPNSSSCTQEVTDSEPSPDEYEECEKRKYADCQNDVVQDIRSRYAKYPGLLSSNTGLEALPAYQPMNGQNTLQVLPAYERYDPDICHLQQVHGYVNQENHGQLSDLEQYDNIPDLPKKSKKKPNINDLDTYENHSTEDKYIVGKNKGGKHSGDPDQNTVCSLDNLEQYENYNVPKRERGMFRLFKANKAKKETEKVNQVAEPASLNDLQEYEAVESDFTAKKEIKKLDDLDAYENFAIK